MSAPEKLRCPRCGYSRLVAPDEDGYWLYILHRARCDDCARGQLWFAFVNEDDVRCSTDDDWDESSRPADVAAPAMKRAA